MTIPPILKLLPLLGLLGACNMVISETPVFTDSDRARLLPRDGVWLGADPECSFDSSTPESSWPKCALWVVVRDSGREMQMKDGKGESQRVGGFFAAGNPMIVQGQWIDEAKEPARSYYSFYALESGGVGLDGRFTEARVWPIECGIQEESNGDIRPFPGISPECRPSSKEAIRSAANESRRDGQMKEWRWLRAEAR